MIPKLPTTLGSQTNSARVILYPALSSAIDAVLKAETPLQAAVSAHHAMIRHIFDLLEASDQDLIVIEDALFLGSGPMNDSLTALWAGHQRVSNRRHRHKT